MTVRLTAVNAGRGYRLGTRAQASHRPARAWSTATSRVAAMATEACGGSPASAATTRAVARTGAP